MFRKWKCPNREEKRCLNFKYGRHEASISIKTPPISTDTGFESIELTESFQQLNVPVETSELTIT